MKKFIFFILSFSILAISLSAQDGKKMLKEAEKNMEEFIKHPENLAFYQTSINSFEAAFEDESIASESKNWIKKGEIFNDLADNQIKLRLLNPQTPMLDEHAGVTAFEAFVKAMDIATKKGDTKDALNGLEKLETHLSNLGVELYREKKYPQAFQNFAASLKVKNILNANEKESRLDDVTLHNDQVFFTAVSGYFGGLKKESIPYLEMLLTFPDSPVAEESNKPFAYEALYNAYVEAGDTPKAIEYLTEGRAQYPKDSGLLFAEINYYLDSGQNEALIDKLNAARELEPDNLSVINTLGNIYDKMSVSAREKGETDMADEYFDKAMGFYGQVLEQDDSDFTATYSIGALFYNKAASMTEGINELANDFSAEGTKKYNLLKSEMDGYFDEALPYFLKAEELDGKDANTLVALREIYARKNQFEKVNEYKGKYETVMANQQNN